MKVTRKSRLKRKVDVVVVSCQMYECALKHHEA